MSEDKKNLGAPSSDETSALFVSARKKQLAQQEEERKRQEEEEKRLAAEAEVRRLEQEVEARKKAAEEESKRIEEEAKRMEEERERLAKEQAAPKIAEAAGNVGSTVGNVVGSAFGSVAKAAKSAAAKTAEMAQQPKAEKAAGADSEPTPAKKKPLGGGSGGLKINPKMLAIIGGAVVVVIVLLVLLAGGGGGGGKPSSKVGDLFTATIQTFTDMSTADKEAYVQKAIDFLENQEFYTSDLTEETSAAVITATVRDIEETTRMFQDGGFGTALLSAEGLPLTFVAYYCFEDAPASDIHLLLRDNIAYREYTDEEIRGLTLMDFIKLDGNDFISAILTAEDWLVMNEAMHPEHNILMVQAALDMQSAVMYVANSGSPFANAPLGLIAAYGHLEGGITEKVEELTGIPRGTFIAAPEVSDPLDTEYVITAWGVSMRYPGSTFTVDYATRNSLRIYPTSSNDVASLTYHFSENSFPEGTDAEAAMATFANEVLNSTYGADFELENQTYDFQQAEGVPTVIMVTGHFFDTNGDRLDMWIRVGVLNYKPFTTIIVAHPSRIETYYQITENIRGTFDLK